MVHLPGAPPHPAHGLTPPASAFETGLREIDLSEDREPPVATTPVRNREPVIFHHLDGTPARSNRRVQQQPHRRPKLCAPRAARVRTSRSRERRSSTRRATSRDASSSDSDGSSEPAKRRHTVSAARAATPRVGVVS